MQGFFDLMKESFLTRFFLVLIVTVAVVYLYGTGQGVPDPLLATWGIMVGFYFNASQILGQIQERKAANP